MKAIEKLYRGSIIPSIRKEGLAVAIYTQLSDVEDEVNGLITYDRRDIKVDVDVLKKIHLDINEAYLQAVKEASND